MMANIAPVHLMKWIEEHQTLFSGPVANKEVFPESEFIYQIVRGPNARNDFHIDPGDEIFYQLKGDITVRCIDADGTPRDIKVRERDGLAWFCERCGAKLHETTFSVTNIEVELLDAIKKFNASAAQRTCKKCGAVLPVPAGAASPWFRRDIE